MRERSETWREDIQLRSEKELMKLLDWSLDSMPRRRSFADKKMNISESLRKQWKKTELVTRAKLKLAPPPSRDKKDTSYN